MDSEQIYCKTDSGEETLYERTRLVQRNLRNVLILVDGHSTVAELIRRFGDASVVWGALADLERAGYIETVEARMQRLGTPTAEGVAAFSGAPEPAGPVLLPEQADAILPTVEEVVLAEPQATRPKPATKAPALRADRDDAPNHIGREADSGFMRFKPKRPQPEPPPESAPVKVRRGRRARKVNWPLQILGALVVLLVGALAAALLYPYDSHRADIERRLAGWLGQPVSIGSVRFAIAPQPNLTLATVRIGEPALVEIGTLSVVPSLLSLLDEEVRVTGLTADRVTMDAAALPAVLRAAGSAAVPYAATRMEITGLALKLPAFTAEGLSGELAADAGPGGSQLALRNADETLRLTARPGTAGQVAFELSAQAWKPPLGGVTVDALEARGTLQGEGLRIERLEARLLDGILEGSARVGWQKGVTVEADLQQKHLSLARLLPLLSPSLAGQGEYDGRLQFKGSGSSLQEALAHLEGGGTVSAERGTIQRFDLAEALRARSGSPVHGGLTRFDSLAAQVRFEGSNVRLTDLRVDSGALQAGGYLSVRDGTTVSGALEVQIRGSAGGVSKPVRIEGTLADPRLQPQQRRGAASTEDAPEGASES